jgi:hypothetical protein
MFDALSFGEIEDQRVELLPARTVLSMIRVKSGGGVCVGGAGGTGGNGGDGSGGLGVNALNIILFDEQHNEAANGTGGNGGSANGGHCYNK